MAESNKEVKREARRKYHREWQRANIGLGSHGSGTPGKTKVERCQASSLDKFFCQVRTSEKPCRLCHMVSIARPELLELRPSWHGRNSGRIVHGKSQAPVASHGRLVHGAVQQVCPVASHDGGPAAFSLPSMARPRFQVRSGRRGRFLGDER